MSDIQRLRAATTFEPAVVSLADVAHHTFRDWEGDDSLSLWNAIAHAVIAEYRHQEREAGLVAVRREDLTRLIGFAAEFGDLADDDRQAIARLHLAATDES